MKFLGRSNAVRALVVAALVASACTTKAVPDASSARRNAAPPTLSSSLDCAALETTSIAGRIDSPSPGAKLAGIGSTLIPNGDFSHGLAGWVLSDPETARLDDTDRDQGQALRVRAEPTTKLRHINSPRFAVTSGAAYKLTLGARIAAGAAQPGSFSVVFFASRVSRDPLRLDLPSGPPHYFEYTFTGTVPVGASHAMLQFLYDRHQGSIDLSIYDVRYAETGTVDVVGWAIDRSTMAAGPGIEDVSLYLDGPPGVGTLLGPAAYGDTREDVASACGGDRFMKSGWRYVWDISALAPGEYTLYAIMRSVGGITSQSKTTIRRLPVHRDDPIGAIDTPVAGAAVAGTITIAGWAIDRNSVTGTGVDSVRLYLDGQPETAALLGEAEYGHAYPGVARHFGDERFTKSGWHFRLDTTKVPAGSHSLSVVLHSSIPGQTTTLSRALMVSDGREITLRSPAVSSRSRSATPLAVDGSYATAWNAGDFPPQWIEVDLKAPVAVARLRLVTAQTPSGSATHRVYGRVPAGDMRLLHEFAGYTADGDALEHSPQSPWSDVRFIRVETVASPSWVAWREVTAYVAGPTPTTTVSGTVASAETHIVGARVDLRSGDLVIQSAFTDDRGAYTFAAIPAGVYAVRVHAPSAAFKRWSEVPLHIVDAEGAIELEPLELPTR